MFHIEQDVWVSMLFPVTPAASAGDQSAWFIFLLASLRAWTHASGPVNKGTVFTAFNKSR